jgi:polysaccharide pyruvyl transferase WcaK-like protein
MTTARRVLQTGTFDVRNYGDLLFPLIAGFRLAQWNIEIQPISPTGFDTGWRDAARPSTCEAMLGAANNVDGILIGGGNIIHSDPVRLPDYMAAGVSDWAYPSLWLGATLAGAICNVPIVWNAPGVPVPLAAQAVSAGAKWAFKAADYVSVRDQPSAEHLGNASDSSIVPDTAVDIAALWPRHSLSLELRSLFERKITEPCSNLLVIHVKERSINTDHATIAKNITEFAAAFDLTPILIAIGQCHGDHMTALRLSRHLHAPHILLDDPVGLREIAAVIAHAKLYVGASLHGYITAAAYDVPGVIVAQPALPKFKGFLAHIGRPHDLVGDWSQAFTRAASLLAEPFARRIPEAVIQALDAHWDRVGSVFVKPAHKMADRTRFLRHYIQWGSRTRGMPWIFEPMSPRFARS